MAILTVGIDLAKNVFAIHGVNEAGKAELVRPSVPRAKLHELIATLPPCTIGMEACTGAHHSRAAVRSSRSYRAADGTEVRRPLPALGQARQERRGRCRGYLRSRKPRPTRRARGNGARGSPSASTQLSTPTAA
jgi:transposase